MHFVENTQVGAVFLRQFTACCWTVRYMLRDGDEITAMRVEIESRYREKGTSFLFWTVAFDISEKIKLEDCAVIEKGN